jgi:hypothetical protein
MSYLDPNVWGPHYWFFLHTISMTYPHHPNEVTKKKYYEFIQNLPLFIPVETMSSEFSKLIDQYPITPYLDNRESFVRWVWFIHEKYYEAYKPNRLKNIEYYKLREKALYGGVIVCMVGSIYYLYDK